MLQKKGVIKLEKGKIIINSKQKSDFVTQGLKMINEDYPTDIYYLGLEHEFIEGLPVHEIKTISNLTLSSDKENKLLVLNDMYNQITLSDDEYSLIYEWVYKKKNAFFVIGLSQMEKLNEHGFLIANMGDYYSGLLIYYSDKENDFIYSYGTWNADSQKIHDEIRKEYLDDILIHAVECIVREKK